MLREIEKEVKEFWEKNNIPEKALSFRKGCKKFFFMDGPPYATGYIHMGTAWNKILKDFYIRFFRMLGYDVWAQPGYDTHGLPIENKVEKKLGFKSKQDIEKYGIEKFNEECRKFATEFIEIMNSQFSSLGVWMNWKNPYLTLHNSYIESAWFTFKKAFEKGLLYKARYPVHVCPRCETAVAYNEVEHAKLEDFAIAVKFKVKDKENEYLVIWTTTPWTLPANIAIMVNPNFEYAKVKVGKDVLIIAKELVEKVMKKARIEQYEIIEVVKGEELGGLEYEPIFPELPCQKGIKHRVVLSEQFVTLEEGTGLVHCAPGHGMEDFKVGRAYGLAVICPVNMNGRYTEDAGKYAGMHVRDEANEEIIKDLEEKGVVLFKEKIVHDYPICWRCKTPLLFLAVEQWFFRVSAIRKKLLEENEKVYWVPSFAKQRFKNWLESLDDWPISRQRYWGIPLPIWICEKCGEVKVIGSVDELPEKPKDLHRPYVDEIILNCEKCGGKMKRVKDVLDVWFDSGVASWASLNYPREKELFEEMWPSDLQIEGPDQIRGWWNSQLITSVITFDRAPFKRILMHGLVLDEKGVKMSKSLGNIVNPEDVAEKYGTDVLRFGLLRNDPSMDFYFSWRDMENVRKFFTIFINTYNYFETYCKKTELDKSALKKEDLWLLSRFNSLVKYVRECCEKIHGHKALQEIENFVIEDLSRWYIKLVRDRKDEGVNMALSYVLEKLLYILAPAIPFTAEWLYQKYFASKESVHMCDFPEVEEELIDKELEEKMEIVKEIVEAIYHARHEAKIKTRYVLKGVKICSNERVLSVAKELEEIIKKMTNVESVSYEISEIKWKVKLNYAKVGKKYGRKVKEIERVLKESNVNELKKEMDEKGKVILVEAELEKNDLMFIPEEVKEGKEFSYGYVILDTTIDEELKRKWLIRELIRAVQEKRKTLGLNVHQKVKLYLSKEFEKEKSFLEEETNTIITLVCTPEEIKGEKGSIEFEGKVYEFGIEA